MITNKEVQEARQHVLSFFEKACIALTPKEKQNTEIADFGMGRLKEFELQLVVYVNTERVYAQKRWCFPLRSFM